MSIQVDRSELAGAFAWISRALPSRPASPVLAGAKIVITTDSMTIEAFDYEQSSVATIPCTADKAATIIVPGRLTADLSKALADPKVTLTVENRRLLMVAGRSKFSLPLFPAEDYPSLPTVPPRLGTMLSEDFAAAVKRVAVAAGRDDTLPTLTGVLVTTDPDSGTLTLAATDRYRLAVVSVDYTPEKGSDAVRLLVPAKILDGYAKTVEAGQTISLLGGTGALFGIQFGGRSASTRMLDGDFPKYESLLPKDFSGVAEVNVHEVMEAIRRVALVAERNVPVRCTFTQGALEIAVGASDEAAASEVVDIDYDGEDFSTAFNPGYFADGLSTIPSERARLQLTAPNKPALVVPTTDDDGKYLLMPVRLGS